MGTRYGPPIVTDSLKVYFDNFNDKTYLKSRDSSTLTSLVGNYTANIVQGMFTPTGGTIDSSLNNNKFYYNYGAAVVNGTDCSTAGLFFSTENFSVNTWMMCVSGGYSQYNTAISTWNTGASTGSNGWIVFWQDNTLKIGFSAEMSNNSVASIYTTKLYPRNKWMNICAIKDSLTIKLYVDGSLSVSTLSANLSILHGSERPLYIGAFQGNASTLKPTYVSQAYIPVTMIYTKALTDKEVLQNYNALKGRFI
jgi:hypothetical protein